MAESFYGGRRGAGFIIQKSYSSVAALIEDFGRSTCEVQYDEYGWIDSNDADNGKIYRRVYNGAKYIGQLKGINGQTPTLQMTTLDDIDSIPNSQINSKVEGSYDISNGLVPGKYVDNGVDKFNDEIQWISCNFTDGTNNLIAYIGFQIPYPVIEINARVVEEGETLPDNLISKDTSMGNHPFYNKFNLVLPRGVAGNSFKNLRVIQANSTIESYEGQEQDILDGNFVLVYDYYDYSVNPNGIIKTIYLGEYKLINDIVISDDGTVTIIYTDKTVTKSKLIKWINQVELTNGQLNISYNTGDIDSYPLIYPNNIEIGTGTLNITYSNGNVDELPFIYPVSIDIDEDTQEIIVTYNDNTVDILGEPINSIESMKISNDYHLLALYTSPKKRLNIKNNGLAYSQTIDGHDDWHDLGSIKDDGGILIGKNFTLSTYPTFTNQDTVITYLNTNYPNGLTGLNMQGKIVTVTSDNGESNFYAFDYTKENNVYLGWYYLGGFTQKNNLIVASADTSDTLILQQLDEGGIWLVVEE